MRVMKFDNVFRVLLGLLFTLCLTQVGAVDSGKPITFEDVLRQLLGLQGLRKPADRIMNSEMATKLRDSLRAADDVTNSDITSSQTTKVLSSMTSAHKPSRFDDDLLKSAIVEAEVEPDDEKNSEKEDASETEVVTDAATKDASPLTPDRKWKKPSRFDGSYDELMQEWKLKQAAISKMAAATNKKVSEPENGETLSGRTLGLNDRTNRPNHHHRQKRFFFSWPGSFESPWPERERTENTFISGDPTVIQTQQVFRLFSNSFLNGFREFARLYFRLDERAEQADNGTDAAPASDAAAAADESTSALATLSSSENELKKRTLLLSSRIAAALRRRVNSSARPPLSRRNSKSKLNNGINRSVKKLDQNLKSQ